MPKEPLRYEKMVESALRGVVRDALKEVEDAGMPGNHHFYLTFRTGYPGVAVPSYLSEQYPNEMTIVLQYQYYGLEVMDDHFAVTLSFHNKHERLVVPFAAITTFADPSVNFALQFQPLNAEDEVDLEAIPPHPATDSPPDEDKEEAPKRGEVVALDAFRKKQ
ncbi:hypothetical protein M2352_001748 [Azospirillum fermentarium]|uniref:SspB family protein n=1 Tax=Azospirillum fermentarium TaxID=1233114 RepID=UPI0022274A82|nr:ClpXP protease specificity-enhancing factor SspB [Azospirillum fermentarium]MCW2246157.1 hypothetical protein [Azospirillum fermentarium]